MFAKMKYQFEKYLVNKYLEKKVENKSATKFGKSYLPEYLNQQFWFVSTRNYLIHTVT
jgi:hypothetical protein